jgi:ketosteroid isomerase-like protein
MTTSIAIATRVLRSAVWKAVEALGERFWRQPLPSFLAGWLAISVLVGIAVHSANAFAGDDRRIVAGLDTEYQAAVKSNDAATMSRILADDFVLVTGSGTSYTKSDLINDARSGQKLYEHNEELEQKVRVWGDTAVVTAKLWEKGTDNGKPFNHTLWFSDTYARTQNGWHYVFGQSSLPLPETHQ